MNDKIENRRHHDMGGLPAGPVDGEDHEPDLWEKRVDAMMVCLAGSSPGGQRLITVDQIRRAIEDLPPEAYDTMSYYERWVRALATILTELGVVTADELQARLAEVKARPPEPANPDAGR
jgi:hypothetical protein